MIKNLLKPWPMRLFLQKISILSIAVTGVMIAVCIGFSVYGNNVGSFVIGIEENTRLSLTLSESGDFNSNDVTSLLNAEGLKNATNTTYGVIPKDIDNGNGAKNDIASRRYTAYSFYIKNTSSISVSYNMTIQITSLHKAVDEALRVMVITNGKEKIYAKPDKNGFPESHLDIPVPYTTTSFVSATTVCSEDTMVFNKDEVIKYTVVMWLEGYDDECVDDIKGGAIKLAMQFSAH